MTRICVPLIDEQTAGIIDRMVDLADRADLFEVRTDFVRDLDMLMILRAKMKPLIFTCRPVSEGGQFPDADPKRRLILLEAVKRGFDYVDVEFKSQFHDVMVEKAGEGLIVSYHDLAGTPENLSGLYDRMCAAGADIVKIVTTPASVSEVGRLMAFAERVSRDGGPPLVALAMGPLGTLSRILAGRYDAPFTFASSSEGQESAPGQIPVQAMADLYRVRELGPNTKVYGILGQGTSRSLSPVIHNTGFRAQGVDAVYVPLEADALAPFIEALPLLRLSGFSVTRPYKVEILPYLDEVEELASVCGSVNTVVAREGHLTGSSTDGVGLLVPLKKRIEIEAKNVVVIGAGGAARAAAFALRRQGAFVTVLARDEEKAAEVAQATGCEGGTLSSLASQTWDVLINATPVGSVSMVHETPVPGALHRPGSIVFDMVYVPQDTRLLREARQAGCKTIGGLEMLLAQAEGQYQAWTGKEPPADAMRQAVLEHLEENDAVEDEE